MQYDNKNQNQQQNLNKEEDDKLQAKVDRTFLICLAIVCSLNILVMMIAMCCNLLNPLLCCTGIFISLGLMVSFFNL